MATNGTFRAEERKARLLASLASGGMVQLDQAAAELGVSAMTVRRDLDELEAAGLARRVRGGAVSILGPSPFNERRAVRSRAKRAIAEKALDLVPAAGAVALDASTTAGTIGELLGPRSGLTIATNSYDNFLAFQRTPGVRAVLVGGEAEENTGSFVGPIACQAAGTMLYERFFASASAVDEVHGTSEVSLLESQVKRAFAGVAREVVLCVDSTKLGQRSIALGLALAEVSVMITDLDPRDSRLDGFRDSVELR